MPCMTMSWLVLAASMGCPLPESDPSPCPPRGVAQVASAAAERTLANDPRYGLLTPLPEKGNLPPIFDKLYAPSEQELAMRAKMRDYARQIRLIRSKHFGDIKVASIRSAGLDQLREFVDPAAFRPMWEELRRENDDIRLAVLDHLQSQGEMGQAALAWIAIHESNKEGTPGASSAVRHEAMRRMSGPVSMPVLQVLDSGLRSQTHHVANNAAAVAGSLNAIQTVPLLIFAQVTNDPVREQGDLAWIAIATQSLFVVDLQAVVANGAVAFEPVVATITEGTVMRVVDAVAVSYRVDVHRSLVAMTTSEWGQSTEALGYDPAKWWAWYNSEFVPFLQKKLELAKLADPPAPAPAKPAGSS